MIRITTDVFCDGCGNWAHYKVSDVPLNAEAQRAATKAGWTFDTHRKCKCPTCNGSNPKYWRSSLDAGARQIPAIA